MEYLLVGDTEHGQQPDGPAQLAQHPAGERAHSQPREVRARDEYVYHGAVAAVEEVFHFTGKLVAISETGRFMVMGWGRLDLLKRIGALVLLHFAYRHFYKYFMKNKILRLLRDKACVR